MKMSRLINAVESLQKLANVDLPLDTAYKLKKLFGNLQGDVDFYVQETQKGTDRKELLNFDIDDYEKIDIQINNSTLLSVNDIEALEPFVNFKSEAK